MTLLILGGTADAKQIARSLYSQAIPVIYSIAGLVRFPDLDCKVISGGFSRLGGLTQFLKSRKISAVMDATHPYAQTMSITAVEAARACQIPIWRYQRPPWQPSSTGQWIEFECWPDLMSKLQDYRAVFFTTGQLSEVVLKLIANNNGQLQWLRTAVEPEFELPSSMTWIKAIGPFSLAQERAIMSEYQIDALVSKNSGGDATCAKLKVARENKVPVYLLKRPALPEVDREFSTVDLAIGFVVGEMTG